MFDGKMTDAGGEGFKFPQLDDQVSPTRWTSRLGSVVYYGIMAGLILVLARAAWEQVFKKDYWTMQQSHAQSRTVLGNEQRGRILDRHGRFLALDRIIQQVAIDPDQLSRRYQELDFASGVKVVIEEFKEVLPVPLQPEWSIKEILIRLEDSGVEFLRAREEMEQELLNAVRNNLLIRAGVTMVYEEKSSKKDEPIELPRVRYRMLGTIPDRESRKQVTEAILEIESKEAGLGLKLFPPRGQKLQRFYPYEDIGLVVIGEVDRKNRFGLWGMESYWDHQLKMLSSMRKHRATPGGQSLGSDRFAIPGKEGTDLRTTIDIQLQAKLNHLVKANQQRTAARRVSAAVVDPYTGEIHAWTTYPALKRGQLNELATEDLINGSDEGMKQAFSLMSRLQRVSMAPGSVVKPLILARAIQLGVPLKLPLDVRGENQRIEGRSRWFRDSSLLREKTPEGAVVFSSNIGMVLLGVKLMRMQDVESILRQFGFGSKTGIELPGEERGLLKPIHQWNRYTWESACFGYEMMVTPVQVMRAYMAIANGGYLLRPTFLVKEQSDPGEIILSEDVARECRRVLRRAVKDGTGRHVVHHVGPELKSLIRSSELEIAGKTGTTKLMKEDGSGFSENRYNSSFVGFAPVENARFLTIVLVEEPTPEGKMYYASKSAAPLGAQILASALNLRGFNPLSVPIDESLDSATDSAKGNLAISGEAGNVGHGGFVGGQTQTAASASEDQGQEGEPDRW